MDDQTQPETSHRGIAARHLVRGGSWRPVIAMVVLFVAIACSAVAFNAAMDPRSDFGTGLGQPLTVNIPAEKMRRFQSVQSPETLVLGSSRAFTLAPDDINALGLGPAFNFAVGSATPDADLAIYRYVAERHVPNVLVLEMDVEQLRPGWPEHWHVRITPGLGDEAVDPVGPLDWAKHALGTIEPTYLRDSLQVLGYQVNGYPPVSQSIHPDGLLVSPAQQAALADGTFDVTGAVQRSLPDLLAPYSGMTALDPRQVHWFQETVRLAAASGTDVHILFPPLHPIGLAAANATAFPQFQAEALGRALELCGALVHVHDYTLLSSFGGTPDDFVDGKHYGVENGRRIIERLFAQDSGDLCMRP